MLRGPFATGALALVFRQISTPTRSTTTTIAVTDQERGMSFIDRPPTGGLLVRQAVLGLERLGVRAGRHLAVAAHLPGDEQVGRIRVVVHLPVVILDRVEGGEPLL